MATPDLQPYIIPIDVVIISYYLNNSVLCMLDASKAFDMVQFGMLFELLLKKTISRFIVRLTVLFETEDLHYVGYN